jgi:hypothetical protein
MIDLPPDPSQFQQPEDTYLLGPTPADAIRQLRPFVELGVSHILLRTADIATLERFRDEVAPALAESVQ